MNWQAAVEASVTGLGYDIVDCERTPGGLLRVYIDLVPDVSAAAAEEKSITVDDCERVTRQLQYVLEVEGCAYERLEVSSPGLDRPLKKPADYQRFEGSEIDLVLKMAFQGRKKYRGVLHARPDGWRIVFNDGKADQALDFSLDEVREARLVPVIDFKGRRAKPAATPAAEKVAGGASNAEVADKRVDGGPVQ
jgi:ribosome maturation factor RimP